MKKRAEELFLELGFKKCDWVIGAFYSEKEKVKITFGYFTPGFKIKSAEPEYYIGLELFNAISAYLAENTINGECKHLCEADEKACTEQKQKETAMQKSCDEWRG